jgi:hypothetical protein
MINILGPSILRIPSCSPFFDCNFKVVQCYNGSHFCSILFSVDARASGSSRDSLLSATLITLVQKLTTISLGPCRS